MTLLLSASALRRVLDTDTCLTALRDGFTAAPSGIAPQRVRTPLPAPGTATALIPGLVPGVPAYTVKVNAKFPGADPALRGVVCLHDLASGELLALLDSATVTAWRTGLAAALGTHALARPDASSVTVIGAGAQAELVLRGLAALRPLGRLTVVDLDPARAEAFAARHGRALSVEATTDGDPSRAARTADITITATWSRRPFLDTADIPPGAHVTALGADEPGKAELTPGLLGTAYVVVDDPSLASASGALRNTDVTPATTLTKALRTPPPRAPGAITVYAPVGLPWQDLALSWPAYERALEQGEGTHFDFLT
ncbi:Delta(1)-pyrroline-2-carboxylate reductase [Streptomyces sp. RB5]|uniref:Delta(1)-pyrroline-2-carboxylate reductase n=1 Tax=Streptomyces smaragdinus TaxID=2585196 RepID=A0A7K0CI67_9ACTN|nr:ornithine cyclodeaminase family protein [Streptomyces smaragdinus]MQY13178.1 Delta(1)-pyrroline-2-carboxylate reductase [Streptomyces smaragdinus]